MKHGVDKHNLTWVYAPSEINNQIHRLAINLVIFSVVMLQLFQTGVSYLRNLDTNQGDIARLSLVQLLQYCALIGRALSYTIKTQQTGVSNISVSDLERASLTSLNLSGGQCDKVREYWRTPKTPPDCSC